MAVYDPRTPNGNPGGLVYADSLGDDLRFGKYLHLRRTAMHSVILQNGTQAAPVSVPTLPTAVQDNLNTLVFPNAPFNAGLEMYQTTAQTLMPLRHATKGIEIALDQVNNESVEYVPGGNHAANPFATLLGTDPGIRILLTFETAVANSHDQFIIGFRKQENYVVPTSFLTGGAAGYTDFCALGFSATVASPNPIGVVTSIGSAVNIASPAGFTVPITTTVQLEIRLLGRKPRYFINGVELGGRVSRDAIGTAITAQQTIAPPAYTFAAGLTVIPFIFVRQDAATGAIFMRELRVEQLKSVGLAPEQKP